MEVSNIIFNFRQLGAGAESGWDFSSRWFDVKETIESISVDKLLPVDLNSIMAKNELVLERFSKLLGN